MSQVTGPITINNGAATPVAMSFGPERITPELSTFTEKTSGVSAGFKRLSIGFVPATTARPTNHVKVEFSLPILQTVNGVSIVANVARFQGKFIVPDTLAAADRADLHAFVVNALSNALIKGAIKDLDPLY